MTETQNKEERRAQILNAAGRLFARFGLKKTSLEDIAESVGLAKTSIYYYFPKKEDLFKAVIQNESETLLLKLREAINQSPTPQLKIRAYFITRMEYLKELMNLYQLTSPEARELMPMIERERNRFFKSEKDLMLEILTEGIDKQIFEIGNPEFASVAVIASMRGLEPALLLYQDRDLCADDYDAMLHFLFYGILKN